ncbi:MAG TPA: hypothetical protein VJK48_00630 [Chlamydiales bacterium]|nr:MAG: hypothetical protein A3F67_08545 [Verrucomicrobia bacterium RIFCSPHIGHO2_12_FULL_41_10]HLB52199.1 hypothetical protein [Chlamydiales bacterium]
MAFFRSGYVAGLNRNSALYTSLQKCNVAGCVVGINDDIVHKITKRSWGRVKLKSLEGRVKVLNQAIKDRDKTIAKVQGLSDRQFTPSNALLDQQTRRINRVDALVAVEVALLKDKLKGHGSAKQILDEIVKYDTEIPGRFGWKSPNLCREGMLKIQAALTSDDSFLNSLEQKIRTDKSLIDDDKNKIIGIKSNTKNIPERNVNAISNDRKELLNYSETLRLKGPILIPQRTLDVLKRSRYILGTKSNVRGVITKVGRDGSCWLYATLFGLHGCKKIGDRELNEAGNIASGLRQRIANHINENWKTDENLQLLLLQVITEKCSSEKDLMYLLNDGIPILERLENKTKRITDYITKLRGNAFGGPLEFYVIQHLYKVRYKIWTNDGSNNLIPHKNECQVPPTERSENYPVINVVLDHSHYNHFAPNSPSL